MEPQQMWDELADAVSDERWPEAALIAERLLKWVAKGGCPPDITGHFTFDRLIARSTCHAVAAWDTDE